MKIDILKTFVSAGGVTGLALFICYIIVKYTLQANSNTPQKSNISNTVLKLRVHELNVRLVLILSVVVAVIYTISLEFYKTQNYSNLSQRDTTVLVHTPQNINPVLNDTTQSIKNRPSNQVQTDAHKVEKPITEVSIKTSKKIEGKINNSSGKVKADIEDSEGVKLNIQNGH